MHHGNGTEEILSAKPHYLFVSIHVGEIYPHTGQDDGTPRAENVVNISLPPRASSSMFQDAFDNKIIPALDNFKPDILLLSAGFDGHRKDPTGYSSLYSNVNLISLIIVLKSVLIL